MYKRGTYYRYRRSDRLPSKRGISLPSKKVVIACAALLCGISIVGIAHAGNSYWNHSGRGTFIGHKKAQDKYSTKKNSTAETTPTTTEGTVVPNIIDLSSSDKKELAMRLVSTAENSSLDWRAQFGYIEDIGDGRGYTAGIIGFCSGTGDMLVLVENYTKSAPGNPLAAFLPALRAVNGTDSHAGLGSAFEKAWKAAAASPQFQKAQEAERDRVYFNPAVALAKQDGLGVLGQFVYYDAAVMHGPDAWGGGLPDLRNRAIAKAKTPTQGGDQKEYLKAFLDVRKAEMSKEAEHRDVSRIDDAQLAFLKAGNLDLHLPLSWTMYGDPFKITAL